MAEGRLERVRQLYNSQHERLAAHVAVVASRAAAGSDDHGDGGCQAGPDSDSEVIVKAGNRLWRSLGSIHRILFLDQNHGN